MMKTIDLNQRSLNLIGDRIKVPRYGRNGLSLPVVHIGLGNFHRAHEAFFMDKLLEAGKGGGIFEINLVNDHFPIAKIAEKQDNLYTLISRNKDGDEWARVIGSIGAYVNALENKELVMETLAREETSVITMTVTEKGYCWDQDAKDLARSHPGIVHDLEHPEDPSTLIGFLAVALARRYNTNRRPLTLMSCDNFPANGSSLKKCVLSFCREKYPDIVSWIDDAAAFPNSMVDRITPVTTTETKAYLEERYGIRDEWPVFCEDYIQWVLEDQFKVPPQAVFHPSILSLAGVRLVDDVIPYELMKIRLLNGSHSALAYPAYLLGYRGVAEAVEDPLIHDFIRNCYMKEVGNTLLPAAGINFEQYKDTLLRRFSNRNIADTVLRLAQDGSKKIANALLPPLFEMFQRGLEPKALVFALAAWARFLSGADEEGNPIPLDDVNRSALTASAKKAIEDPCLFFETIGIPELTPDEMAKLCGSFLNYLKAIYANGIRTSLKDFLERDALG